MHVCKGHPTENATKFWVTKGGIQLEHNKSQIPTKELKKYYAISWKIDLIY
nr:hypothetical protein [Blautia caecimuris]